MNCGRACVLQMFVVQVKRRALKLAAKMRKEDGVTRGVESFHMYVGLA